MLASDYGYVDEWDMTVALPCGAQFSKKDSHMQKEHRYRSDKFFLVMFGRALKRK